MSKTKEVGPFDLDQYLGFCKALGDAYFFRGQVRHYPKVLPSLYRPSAPAISEADRDSAVRLYLEAYKLSHWWKDIEDDRQRRLEDQFGQPIGGFGALIEPPDWHRFSEMMERLENLGSLVSIDDRNYTPEDFELSLINSVKEKWQSHSDALLQHYGLPTAALDVSFDPLVALWFASFEFNNVAGGRVLYTPASGHDPTVYVFQCTKTEYCDLRVSLTPVYNAQFERLIPFFGLRGERQRGALLLGASSSKQEYTDQVTHRIRLREDIWRAANPRLQKYSFRELFPAPTDDGFYRVLLNVRNAAKSTDHNMARYVVNYE